MVYLRNRLGCRSVAIGTVRTCESDSRVTEATVTAAVLGPHMVARIGMTGSAANTGRLCTDMTGTADTGGVGYRRVVSSRRTDRGSGAIMTDRAIAGGNCRPNVTDGTLPGLTGNGHFMVLDLNRRHTILGVAEITIQLSGIHCSVTIGTGCRLSKGAVVMPLFHGNGVGTDVTTSTIHQGRLCPGVTGGTETAGCQLCRVVHLHAAVQNRLSCVTGLAVQVRDID